MGVTAKGFASKSTKTVINVTAFKIFMAAMAVSPKSRPQLMELTGLCNSTVSRWIKVLSTGKDRIVYLAEYRRIGPRGNYTECFAMGYGMPDAVKPKAKTSVDYNKLWRKKKQLAESVTITQTPTGVIHVRK